MKKFKLFALTALFAGISMNASAETIKYATDANGIRYQFDAEEMDPANNKDEDGKRYSATVIGYMNDVTDATVIEIPVKFSSTNEDKETTYFQVVGFDGNWTSALEKGGKTSKNATGLKSLIINADLETFDFTNAYVGLTGLTSLTIKDSKTDAEGKAAPTDRAIADLGIPQTVAKTLVTLNIQTMGIAKIENEDFAVVATAGSEKWIALTSITLPDALETIGEAGDATGAFAGFKGTSITIPAKVATIGDNAFKKSALASITLPETVTTIGKMAFTESALKAVTYTDKVTSMGTHVFFKCASLESAVVDGLLPISTFKECGKLASVTIGEKVELIGGQAFSECKLLATVTNNSTKLKTIQGGAFKNCEVLKSLDLSKMVAGANITKGTFEGCKALEEVKLSENVTNLKEGLFADCKLKELVAPGVETIDPTVFGQDDADRPAYESLTKVELGAAYIAPYTFANCTKLTDVKIAFADAADRIDANAFYGCTALKTFVWDATTAYTESINQEAFNGCTPYVVINASNVYTANYPNAPKFCVYGSTTALGVKTVADKGGSGKAFMYYKAPVDVYCKTSDAKVYTVYVDTKGGVAYMQSLKVKGENYEIPADAHVIFKTDAPTEVKLSYNDGAPYAVITPGVDADDNIFTVTADTEYATFMAGETNLGAIGENADEPLNATFADFGNYVYRLENPTGNGFGFYSYTKTLKKGQFFVLSSNAPAAGRLNIVWLDENGNVENDATAINSIVKKAQNNGVIYNLAGQKVNAAYKGVVIKDGKKYIQK